MELGLDPIQVDIPEAFVPETDTDEIEVDAWKVQRKGSRGCRADNALNHFSVYVAGIVSKL
jgi:hypothetical protein